MILVRTCGSGTIHNDERLKLLKKMIDYRNFTDMSNKIFKIHDHKGDLSVYWFITPEKHEMKILNDAWEYLCEINIQHFVINITQREL